MEDVMEAGRHPYLTVDYPHHHLPNDFYQANAPKISVTLEEDKSSLP